MYKVEIHVPDRVLVELTREQFVEFRDKRLDEIATLLGFTQHPHTIKAWCDYPRCDKVLEVYTKEVVKPVLFGHALPYTAEAI